MPPRLRTPYGTIGPGRSAIGGAFEGLDQSMQMLLRQALQQREAEKQNELLSKRETQGRNEEAALKAADAIRSGNAVPQDYAGSDLENLIKAKLGNFQMPIMQQAAPVIAAIKPDTTNSEIQAAFDKRGVNTSPQFGMMGEPNKGGVDEDATDGALPTLPSTQYGPVASKPWEAAQKAREEALSALKASNQREVELTGSKANATRTGTLQADVTMQPQTTAADIADLTAKRPVQAANAAATKAAEFDAMNTPERQQTSARGEGLNAEAVAKARFPWEEKLAKAREAATLSNEKALYDYQVAHPRTTAAQLDKVQKATQARTLIAGSIKPELEELDKRGLLGPIQGRLDELYTNKIKTSDLFQNDEDAQLAARFFDDAKLLSSLVANVHGGARAVSSQGTLNYFKNIFNGVGNKPILNGQLGSIDNLMRIYSEKPDTPELFPIPGFNPNQPSNGPAAKPGARFLQRQ